MQNNITTAARKNIFEDFCNTHYRYVTNFIRYKFRIPEQDLLDMTQEVLLYIGTKLESFAGRSSFKTWASSVTLNYCRNKFKYNNALKRKHYNIDADISDLIEHSYRDDSKKLYGIVLEMDFSDRKGVNPENALSYKTTVRKVNESLLKINDEQATVFKMRIFENLNYKEISKILNVNPLTVKTRFFRAKRHVAHDLVRQKYVTV